jgi:hypothetical protein
MFNALGEPNPSGCNLAEFSKASCRVTVYAQGRSQEFKPGKIALAPSYTATATAAFYFTQPSWGLTGLTGLSYDGATDAGM